MKGWYLLFTPSARFSNFGILFLPFRFEGGQALIFTAENAAHRVP